MTSQQKDRTDPSVIRIRDARVSYDDSALPELTVDRLSIAKGEQVALIGPSGAGKTTLVRLISGLVRAETGDIEVLGTPARSQRRATADVSAPHRMRLSGTEPDRARHRFPQRALRAVGLDTAAGERAGMVFRDRQGVGDAGHRGNRIGRLRSPPGRHSKRWPAPACRDRPRPGAGAGHSDRRRTGQQSRPGADRRDADA